MSDQQALMAAQQNPELAQQVMTQHPEIAQQIAPGAMAAASSGMNAPNVSHGSDMWNGIKTRSMNPQMWQALGGIGQMVRQNQPQGALAPAMGMMPRQAMPAGQMAQQMPGVLMQQLRPSRIY